MSISLKESQSFSNFEEGFNKYFSIEYLERIKNIKIGIAGCGGIGSNCAQNLVRCGFNKFLLIDYDIVDTSNLNRQFYFFDQLKYPKVDMLKKNLLKINSDLTIHTIQEKIDSNNIVDYFKDCDVIVEAFDDVLSKKILTENFINSDKFVVAVSGIAGSGNSDEIIIKKIKNNFYIVGDFKSEITDKLHPYSPKINIAAAKQADIIFDYFVKNN